MTSSTSIRGTLFNIQRFSIHDGPGVRTTVFLKGCPLRCLWCHNPESWKRERELSFNPEKCIGCGECFARCPRDAHVPRDGRHVLLRERCERCFACAKTCHAGSLEVIGFEMTVEEVMDAVLRDKPFYENSGGGMTLSGGEPMMQIEFTSALLHAAKAAGLHTCLDTSGLAHIDDFLNLLDFVDLFLYDLKDTDTERHKRTTGVSPLPILENLKKIDAAGGRTVLRCPLIPGINTDEGHLRALAEIAETLKNTVEIALLPYHPLGRSKAERIGVDRPFDEREIPDPKDMERWRMEVSSRTALPVRWD